MRVTNLYHNKKPVISMEFFPPRNEKAAATFGALIDKLAVHQPDYMSVAYIAGFGLGPDDIRAVLDKYKELGVETIMLSSVCGSSITKKLQQRLDAVDADNKDAVQNVGIEFATEQCRDLLKAGVPGLHFYTMDRSQSTCEILNRLKQEKLL